MAANPISIAGHGPRVAALIHAWLHHQPALALAWQTQADDATLERELGLAIERVPEGLRVAGRTIARVDETARFEISIMVSPLDHEDDVRVHVAGKPPINFDPPTVLAIAPVLQALDRGPGLRWASLSILRGRSGELAPRGVVEQSGASLTQALARRLPALAGRLALGLARGPQLGTRIELVALLGGSTTEAVGDVIDHLARQSPTELRACTPGDSATVIGDGRLWIADRSEGVGPLARIVAHLDPDALLANRVWARVASLA
jgi:hypothetical protein